MLIKPFGLCSDCKERKTCVVVTETNARVIECPEFKRGDLRDSQHQATNLTKMK